MGSSDEGDENIESMPENDDEELDANEERMGYDPDQTTEEKRALRAKYRKILSHQEEQRVDLANLKIEDILQSQQRANEYFKHVKAPQEATLDSKVMLQNAEMGAAMARAMKHDADAFDVDDFISELVLFMGGPSQDAPPGDEDDPAEDISQPLEWEKIGLRAYLCSRKAPSMDFMVGPLSLEVKERKKTTRARLEKDKRDEIKPQELRDDEIQRSENETTKMVRLVAQKLSEIDENGVNFFEFVINPQSFAQSIENIFYVSFLVRDGKAAVFPHDETGLLTLYPSEPLQEEERGDEQKKQAVFKLTAQTWKDATELFNLDTSKHIPHRNRPDEYQDEVKDEQFLI
ncbi:nuclear protein [Serendipita sp. 396]|nr:nuclear protein [Serendipita sp. 396]KAG8788112.1 nuclear protein [Serendipita sp. 397]KAG8824067.1 nuclear protein [Serendipita sp. 401]KAG8833107.1 nuclear protein [Serendipita sp. 400]KAG8874797.1 nuclear protein [Serendipita sp. 405]KAG9055517.1 nuclear protein [Serendipita sp. 407]